MAVVASSHEFESHFDGGSGFVTSNPFDRKHSSEFSGNGGSGFVTSNPSDRRRASAFSGNGAASWTSNPLHEGSRQNQQSPLGHQQSTSWSQQSWDQENMRTSSDQVTELDKHKLENTELSSVGPVCHLTHIEDDLIRQFETQFKVVEKVAVMKEVEEMRQKQTVSWERRLVPEFKTVIVDDEVERIELVPEVKYRINMKPEIYYHVVEEEIEVPVTEQVLSYKEKWVTRREPRIVAEEVEEMFKVPVVKQVPKTRTKKVITDEYDDILVMEYDNPGQYNNLSSDISHQNDGQESSAISPSVGSYN